MNTHDRADDTLFTPLTTHETTMSLAELQQYVSANPPPQPVNRTYAVVAIVIMCIGVWMLFIRDNGIKEHLTAEEPSAQQFIPQSLTPKTVHSPDPAVASVVVPRRKVYATPLKQTVEVTEKSLTSDSDSGLMETVLSPDPNIGLSQQFALECNEPSLLVALAKIEFSDHLQDGLRID
jgi:hypothetical protein